jgi:hypothetical protein
LFVRLLFLVAAPQDDGNQSAMQILVMSQKSVYFMQLLIEWHMREAYGVTGAESIAVGTKPIVPGPN